MNLIYLAVIFASTLIGALVGIGGGAIIKSSLDLLNFGTVETVGFISACSVLSMSISSSIKHIFQKTKCDRKTVLLVSSGSVFGGVAGNAVFDALFKMFDTNIVKGIQASILCAFLIFVVIYVNKKDARSFKLKNPALILLVGLFLGLFSSFLGIGGGPINTAFLVLFFSFTIKESAVYSVAIIFFGQLSNLISTFASNRFEPFKSYFGIVIAACILAVIGGIIGARLNKKLNNKVITKIFTITISVVILINIYNALNGFGIINFQEILR